MIHVAGLCKTFHLYRKPFDRLKEIVLNKTCHREHHALKDVTFDVAKGETFGIIGENGSGKSTLLKMITGILLPDSGHFHVDGKITGLLELGTGFNYEFSGIDNIYMNGTYIGLSRKEIDEKLDAIVSFTELGEFINEPIKTYSSGMLMRLAFSVAFHADPACFVVDEALSVGDAHFQQKCIQTLKNFKKNGGSIVFVSHDMNAVKILCERAMLIEKGAVLRIGTPEEVINTYNYLLSKKQGGDEMKVVSRSEGALSYGNQKLIFEGIDMKNRDGAITEIFVSGQCCSVEIQVRARENLDDITIGIMIRDRFGQDIFGVNSFHLKSPIMMQTGDTRLVRYVFDEFNIGPGKYTLTVAAHSQEVHVHDCYQWIDKVAEFEVVSGDDFIFEGVSRLTPKLMIQ